MERIVFENRCDEPFRTFKDGCCGAMRATDGGGDKCVMEIKVIGQMDNSMDHTFESANRVYSSEGISPTINTCQGGGLEVKTIVAMRGRNPENPSDRTPGIQTEQRLEPNSQGICNTLTTFQKDNMVLEAQVLTPKRTEYGKSIRKAYESGEVKESRHNMTEMVPRNDGIANTLTTVQKDNMLLIKQATKDGYIKCKVGGVADLSFPSSKTRRGRVQENGEICPTLMTGQQDICYIDQRYVSNISDEYSFVKSKCQEMLDEKGNLPNMFNPYNKAEITNIAPTQTTSCDRSCSSATVLIKQPQYRIRKLTPRECGRLMGVSDEDISKMEQVNSDSQLYKQFGNSIVVDVMVEMFRNLNIDNHGLGKEG